MRQEFQSDEVIVRYLLNDLGDQEREQIEEKYFNDTDFLDQIDAVEAELIDKYVLGLLSADEREKFERYILNSRSQQQKVEFDKELIDLVEQERLVISPADPEIQPSKTSWWQPLLNFIRLPKPYLALATTALVIVLGGGWLIVENIFLRHEIRQRQREQAALKQQKEDLQQQIDLQKKESDEAVAKLEKQLASLKSQTTVHLPTFLLTLAGSRSIIGEKPKELPIPDGAEDVRLELQLPFNTNDFMAYRAEIETGISPNIPIGKVRPVRGKNRVAVDAPANRLSNGKIYHIKLEGKSPSGKYVLVGKYALTVVKM